MNTRPSTSFRPNLESLDNRLVPSTTVASSVTVVNGVLRIVGTTGADTISVSQEGSNYVVRETGQADRLFRVGSITAGKVTFEGSASNDRFDNFTSLATVANGGGGSDIITGGSGNDVLQGGIGADYLYGNGGSDRLYANTQFTIGADGSSNQLNGGTGLDYLYGSDGNDVMDGSLGEDYLFGGRGDDEMYAARGITGDASYNYLDGGDGNDNLYGGDGFDYIVGGNGGDVIYGFGGNDQLYATSSTSTNTSDTSRNFIAGGDGDDLLVGGNGIDVLAGEAGRDFLYGYGGNDDLNGGVDGQVDELFGGTGDDLFKKGLSLGPNNIDFPNDLGNGHDTIYP